MGVLNEDLHINGSLSAAYFTPPAASITNTSIEGNAGIDATKVIHQFPVRYTSALGSAVTTKTDLLHIFYADATILAVEVASTTPPTTSDTVVIDVKKGNTASSFASILSSTITLNSSSVAKTVYAGTVSTTTAAEGDVLEIVVTVTGSSCQGLIVNVWLREDPQ